jgi:hypothetical protein
MFKNYVHAMLCLRDREKTLFEMYFVSNLFLNLTIVGIVDLK